MTKGVRLPGIRSCIFQALGNKRKLDLGPESHKYSKIKGIKSPKTQIENTLANAMQTAKYSLIRYFIIIIVYLVLCVSVR